MEFQEYWITITSNIRQLLARKGWSIQELADHAGKERAAFSKIISGPQKDMKVSTLVIIAETLEVDVCELFRKK